MDSGTQHFAGRMSGLRLVCLAAGLGGILFGFWGHAGDNGGQSPRRLLEELGDILNQPAASAEEREAILQDVRAWHWRAWKEVPNGPPPPSHSPERNMISFETMDEVRCFHTGRMEQSAGACMRLSQGDGHVFDGDHSLQVDVSFGGESRDKRKGQILAAVAELQGLGMNISPILDGEELSIRAYCSSEVAGSRNKPNGAKLFVEDSTGRRQFSQWQHMRANEWITVSLVVSSREDAAEDKFTEVDFNPNDVSLVGFEIALDRNNRADYSGKLYLDCLKKTGSETK